MMKHTPLEIRVRDVHRNVERPTMATDNAFSQGGRVLIDRKLLFNFIANTIQRRYRCEIG